LLNNPVLPPGLAALVVFPLGQPEEDDGRHPQLPGFPGRLHHPVDGPAEDPRHGRHRLLDPPPRADKEGQDQVVRPHPRLPDHAPDGLRPAQPAHPALRTAPGPSSGHRLPPPRPAAWLKPPTTPSTPETGTSRSAGTPSSRHR